MKSAARILIALTVISIMLFCAAVPAFAATVKASIETLDIANSVKKTTIDFEEYQIQAQAGKLDYILSSGGLFPASTIQMIGDRDTVNHAKKFAAGEATYHVLEDLAIAGANKGKSLVYTYDPATADNENNVLSDFRLYTSALCNDDPSGANPTKLSYDYAELSFDLYFKDITESVVFQLKNTPLQYLFFIEPDGKVYLRTYTNSTLSNNYIDTDKLIGTIEAGKWANFKVQLIPQEGKVGFYNYSIWLNNSLCSWKVDEADESTRTSVAQMTPKSGDVDNMSLADPNTRIVIGMKKAYELPTKPMTWALDNVDFELFEYTTEPINDNIEIPTVKDTELQQFVSVWNSSFINSSSIINVLPFGTMINGDPVFRFDGVAGSSSADSQYQKAGTFTKDGFTVKVNNDGSVDAIGATKIEFPLSRSGQGNKYLSGNVISSDYKIVFSAKSNADGTLTFKVGDASFGSAGISQTEAEYCLTVENGNYSLQKDGTVVSSGTAAAVSAGSVLTVTVPGNVTVSDMDVSEKQTVKSYYITVGGENITISAVRANYLNYLAAKIAAGEGVLVKPIDYNTADRRAVRPVGKVQFDSATYYYAEDVKVSVNKWGTSVNSPATTDVTFWGTNVSSTANPDKIAELKAANPALTDEEAQAQADDKLERNYFLKNWVSLYMEDGAFVTRLERKPDNFESLLPENDTYTYTAGFQANLKQKDGVKDMETPLVSEYFRYSFSVWYDSTTFSDDGFTLSIGFNKKIGDKNLPPHNMLKITKGEGGLGQLTILSSSYDNINEDTIVDLENGWNTVEMLLKYDSNATAAAGDRTYEIKDEAGEVTGTITYTPYLFNTQYTINNDVIYHDNTDFEKGMIFVYDCTFNPCTEECMFVGTAKLVSDGTEEATELQRLAVRDFKLEYIHDEEIDVNCYKKGTASADVLLYSDFNKSEVNPDVASDTAGSVKFTNQNDRLIVEHKANGSTAYISYVLDAEKFSNAMTFDFSFYMPSEKNTSFDVKCSDVTLLSVDENGNVKFGLQTIATVNKLYWNTISLVIEKISDSYVLTVYVGGEIVTFRAPISNVQFTDIAIVSHGDSEDSMRLDDLAVSNSNVPTSLVYMLPVTYVTNGGQLSGGNAEQYHVIGTVNTVLPIAAKEGASFDGWYHNEALTSKALVNISADIAGIKASKTTPVVLYAKYVYTLSYAMNGLPGTAPETKHLYGNITIPNVSGVVYWRTGTEGNYTYVKPGEVYKVTTNTAFTAIGIVESKNVDYIRAVNSIDRNALYRDLYAAVKSAEALGLLAEANDSGVIAANAEMVEINDILSAKLQAANNYLAIYAQLCDETKTYAERRAIYNRLTVDVDPITGLTLRQTVDATVFYIEDKLDSNGEVVKDENGNPVKINVEKIFEANSELATYNRSFDRINEAVAGIILANDVYTKADKSTFSKRFAAINALYAAYAYCTETSTNQSMLNTYTASDFALYLAAEELDATKYPMNGKAPSYFIGQAKTVIDAYNAEIAVYNVQFFGAVAASDACTARIDKPGCIMAVLDELGKALGAVSKED